MSLIFEKLIDHSNRFTEILEDRLVRSNETHNFPWENKVFHSTYVRRAHLDAVDKREDKKLYMMHLCVFPSIHSTRPIYGFDLIAGPKKVTGAFHDISPGLNSDDSMMIWFGDRVRGYEWSKPRDLPDWAKQIFSKSMVAAGNIKTIEELDEVLDLSVEVLNHYLDTVENDDLDPMVDSTEAQNKYCHFQKHNPHTPRVMESLGFESDLVRDFIDNCLFPEIK